MPTMMSSGPRKQIHINKMNANLILTLCFYQGQDLFYSSERPTILDEVIAFSQASLNTEQKVNLEITKLGFL